MKKIKLIAIAIIIMVSSLTTTYAQSTSKTMTQPPAKTELKDSVYYTCTMHPVVMLDKAGKCPKCGMELDKKTVKMSEVKGEKKTARIIYTCSMHPELKADKPGKCPSCGMELREKKTEKKEKPHGHSHGDDGHHH